MKPDILRNAVEKLDHRKPPIRWNGCGKSDAAILIGFTPPDNDDPSGIWKHPEFGDVPDDKIPQATSFILSKWTNYHFLDDLNGALSLMNVRLNDLIYTLESAIEQDYEAPARQIRCGKKVLQLIIKASELARAGSI